MDMETAAENVEEAAKDVNRLVEYVNSQIPNIINFGLKVVLSLICFFYRKKADPVGTEISQSIFKSGKRR